MDRVMRRTSADEDADEKGAEADEEEEVVEVEEEDDDDDEGDGDELEEGPSGPCVCVVCPLGVEAVKDLGLFSGSDAAAEDKTSLALVVNLKSPTYSLAGDISLSAPNVPVPVAGAAAVCCCCCPYLTALLYMSSTDAAADEGVVSDTGRIFTLRSDRIGRDDGESSTEVVLLRTLLALCSAIGCWDWAPCAYVGAGTTEVVVAADAEKAGCLFDDKFALFGRSAAGEAA